MNDMRDTPTRRNHEHTVAGRYRRMRRADREVLDVPRIGAIVAACRIVRVAYADAEGLTIVPMNFGYEYSDAGALVLYLHSAPAGRKIDAIRAAGNALAVTFEMETDCEVIEGHTSCNWGEAFKSVVGNGTASIVDDPDEARHGLQLLMAQQAGMPNVEFTEQQVQSVTVWKIEAARLTAKIHAAPAPKHRPAA